MSEEGVLKLTVRSLSASDDSFEVEIPEDETVESLVVIIYSLRPDLGEELRICHKQRALNPEAVLKDAGVCSGDLVVAARRPKSTKSAAQESSAAFAPAPRTPPEDTPAQSTPVAAVAAGAPAEGCLPGQCPSSYWRALHARFPGTIAKAAASPAVRAPTEAAPPTQEAPLADAPLDQGAEAKGNDGLSSLPEQGAPSATLLELAERVDAGLGDAHPGELAAVLRRTAGRVKALEGGLGEMGHMMEMLHMLSGRALQAFGGNDDGSGVPRAQGAQQREEEAPRSFLVKKGDADIHEQHRLAASQRPSHLVRQTSGGSSASGCTLASGAAPMSKEEMDKARRARLERLEAQQAEKKKEQEEADLKAKSREAMYNSFSVGPAKPLGKF